MTHKPFNVLFLCTGNSARSLMAEAILNAIGKGRFKAYSAGSHPAGAVHPLTLKILQLARTPSDGLRSKSWDEFAEGGIEFDFVFTVCDQAAAEPCPAWPGQPMTAHWGVPDPAKATGSEAEVYAAFEDAYRVLGARLGLFVELPLASLDRLSLQNRLSAIGAAT